MQFKSITMLILLLGLVALAHGVAIAGPGGGPPQGYNKNSCNSQCHSALQPLANRCETGYQQSGHSGNHHPRGNNGVDLNQYTGNQLDVEITSISLTIFSNGCHKCYFQVLITCVYGYTQTYWDQTFFAACIDQVTASCY